MTRRRKRHWSLPTKMELLSEYASIASIQAQDNWLLQHDVTRQYIISWQLEIERLEQIFSNRPRVFTADMKKVKDRIECIILGVACEEIDLDEANTRLVRLVEEIVDPPVPVAKGYVQMRGMSEEELIMSSVSHPIPITS